MNQIDDADTDINYSVFSLARYTWMEMPEHEKKRLNYQHNVQAHRTPTLVGCALAVRNDYFLSIGGFDDDMEIWGGENIEIAFRVWMCGGQVIVLRKRNFLHSFDLRGFSYHIQLILRLKSED